MSVLRQGFREIRSFGATYEEASTTTTVLSEKELKLEHDWAYGCCTICPELRNLITFVISDEESMSRVWHSDHNVIH